MLPSTRIKINPGYGYYFNPTHGYAFFTDIVADTDSFNGVRDKKKFS